MIQTNLIKVHLLKCFLINIEKNWLIEHFNEDCYFSYESDL